MKLDQARELLSHAMRELASGDGDSCARMDRAEVLITQVDPGVLPDPLCDRLLDLQENLAARPRPGTEDCCSRLTRCLREIEGALNPHESPAS